MYLYRAEGEDYILTSLEFRAGPIEPRTGILLIPIIDDNVVEYPRNESVFLQVFTVPIGHLAFPLGQDVIEGIIVDDDCMSKLIHDIITVPMQIL